MHTPILGFCLDQVFLKVGYVAHELFDCQNFVLISLWSQELGVVNLCGKMSYSFCKIFGCRAKIVESELLYLELTLQMADLQFLCFSSTCAYQVGLDMNKRVDEFGPVFLNRRQLLPKFLCLCDLFVMTARCV